MDGWSERQICRQGTDRQMVNYSKIFMNLFGVYFQSSVVSLRITRQYNLYHTHHNLTMIVLMKFIYDIIE